MLYLLEEMSQDGGLVVGFGVFIPFEEKEMETFFGLCDRAQVVEAEVRRVEGMKPCPQVLSTAERWADTNALFQKRDNASKAVEDLSKEIVFFRQAVLARFKASRK